jgi:hypothetical protein
MNKGQAMLEFVFFALGVIFLVALLIYGINLVSPELAKINVLPEIDLETVKIIQSITGVK